MRVNDHQGAALVTSLISIPLLRDKEIPAKYQARQFIISALMLERFVPPNTALCTLMNMVLTGTYMLIYNDHRFARERLTLTIVAYALGGSVMLWKGMIMNPVNTAMVGFVDKLQNGEEKDGEVEKQFKQTQAKWQKLNYGELSDIDFVREAHSMCSSISVDAGILRVWDDSNAQNWRSATNMMKGDFQARDAVNFYSRRWRNNPNHT